MLFVRNWQDEPSRGSQATGTSPAVAASPLLRSELRGESFLFRLNCEFNCESYFLLGSCQSLCADLANEQTVHVQILKSMSGTTL